MEGWESAAPTPSVPAYRPCLEAEKPGVGDFVPGEEARSLDQCEPMQEMDDSLLMGGLEAVAAAAEVEMAAVAADVTVAETSVGKRKRGRPPRGQVKVPVVKKKKDEEDVCFICFDGGNLVLCDRRGCPKAYHPACIKRDEAFFRSKARWNCGWHICSSCEKSAHYMCYTCTYSLCKGCIKDAEILCVRANKGFCTTCMRTIMLIENKEQVNNDMVQVDFDDKSSWEYLFKVYWIYLKGKLSLTLDELTGAKNPWKGPGVLVCKGESSDELYDANGDKGFGSFGKLEGNTSKRRKYRKQPKLINKEDSLDVGKSGSDRGTSLPEGSNWASKELLEFVVHMKNGDTSVLSQFDVQALLLEYIKRNNLRDPRRKSQIVCDSRLQVLFGKVRVGHFEMLKLLESHFLGKEVSCVDVMQGGVVDPVFGQVEADGIHDNELIIGKDKRIKPRKKSDNRGPQTNLDEYAAIDAHNINLIYLRRNMMENLIEDAEKFCEKVVGAFVRIRISSSDQKQDMYRLVQVVDINKAAVPYKFGQKTTDVMLEILNLDKKEVISLDAISNQEFSEDECRRLCQSIKCGLVKHLTVGEIQAKAMTLRALKLNEWLESEMLRLGHLRDRASEKGLRKELRECVEKLQLLNAPEERDRRLHEIPEVHAGLNMNPSNESGEDDNMGSRYSGFSSRGRMPSEPTKNMYFNFHPDKVVASGVHGRVNEISWNRGRDVCKSSIWGKPRNQVDLAGSVAGSWNNQAAVTSGSPSVVAPETLTTSLSTGTSSSVNNSETERMWHYQDPTGKIQGPFSMVQLRKWSTSGFFPPDLRIWRMIETQDDSVLLTDALDGQYHGGLPLLCENYVSSEEVKFALHDRENNLEVWSGSMNSTLIDSKQNAGGCNSNWSNAGTHCNDNNKFVRSDEGIYHSSDRNAPPDIVISEEGQAGSFPCCTDTLEGNHSWPNQPQVHSSFPSPKLSEKKPCETVAHQVREDGGQGHDFDQNNGKLNSLEVAEHQTKSEHSNEKKSNSCSSSGQTSGQNWKPPSSNGWNSDVKFDSLAQSSEAFQLNLETDVPNRSSSTPKPSNGDQKGQAAENTSNAPVQDSGPSWSSASSLVGGGAQLPEVAGDGEWGGYSPTPAKPSVEEWDSSLVSVSLLKPAEASLDHAATPTSNTGQLNQSSPSHPTSHTSSWPVIVAESNEESVSDLLAEVDAMESLNGLPSPTSIMKCGGELAQVSKNDGFSSIEGLSPTADIGKSDALSSTGDFQLSFQPTATVEPHGLSNADVLDPQYRSSGQSSTSAEVEGETKPSDVSVNQWEAGPRVEPLAPSTTSWGMTATDTTWKTESETTNAGWDSVPGNENVAWGGSAQQNTNMALGSTLGITQDNANMNWGVSAGHQIAWGSQQKYAGESLSVPRDRAFQVGSSGVGRSRPSWNRQSSFGGGGGSSRPPPKGQRICKFYESGRCKKGAHCDYLHP